MALGTPVVTTTVGCEGLPVQRNAHALISDTAAAFSTAVLDLLGDLNRRQRLANTARAMVESRYDWRLIGVRAAGSVRAAIAENPRERTIIA
jgi:glycosyltransferase involved in cell wall biosynthesis